MNTEIAEHFHGEFSGLVHLLIKSVSGPPLTVRIVIHHICCWRLLKTVWTLNNDLSQIFGGSLSTRFFTLRDSQISGRQSAGRASREQAVQPALSSFSHRPWETIYARNLPLQIIWQNAFENIFQNIHTKTPSNPFSGRTTESLGIC